MAFPTIPTGGRILTANQLNTTAARVFPAISGLTRNTGDLLLAIVGAYQSSAASGAVWTWSAGWTELTDQGGTTSNGTISVAYRWADGSETTPTATQAATITGDASMILMSIPGAHTITAPAAGTIVHGTAAAADPAALDPANWAAEDTLWISIALNGMTAIASTWDALTTPPTNYTDAVNTNAADTSTIGDCELGVAFRLLNASSEDVGTWTQDLSNARNSALVLAVRPKAEVTLTAASVASSAVAPTNLVQTVVLTPATVASSAVAVTPPAPPTPQLLHQADNANGGVANLSFTLPGAGTVPVGSKVILVHANDWYNLTDLLTPTGTAVTTWAARGGPFDGGASDNHVKVWEGVVATAGGTVIANSSTDEEKYAGIWVFDADSSFDKAAWTEVDTTSTSHVAPSLTPDVADEFLICLFGKDGNNGAINYTAMPGGMTAGTEYDPGGSTTFRAAWQTLSGSAATGTRTATASGAMAWFGLSVLVKATAAGTPGAVTLTPAVVTARAKYLVDKPWITSIAGSGTTSYFADQNGNPILMRSYAVWMLFSHAGRWGGTPESVIDTAINDLKTMGANAVMIKAFSHTTFGSEDSTGNTHDDITPFVGGDIGVLNDTFWTRMDYFLNSALAAGITVLLNVVHGTSDLASGGILNGKTTTQMGQFGAALGARYKYFPNIIWMMGGDYFDTLNAEMTAFKNGLRGAGDNHLISVQNYAETTSRKRLDTNATLQTGTDLVDFNFVYSYNVSYDGLNHAYGESSPIPAGWMDGYYDQNTAGSRKLLRDQYWWSLSSGGRGIQHGSEGTWQWPTGAAAAIDTETFPSTDMKGILDAFVGLTGWHQLVPDTDNSFLTAGRGTHAASYTAGGGGDQYTPADAQDGYVTAAVKPDGKLAVVYFPVDTTVTVNPAELVSSYEVFWMDPVTGATTPQTISGTYSPTGTNSRGGADWVLVFRELTGVTLTPATVASSAVALTPIPTVALTPASVASSAVSLIITPTAVLTAATVASSAVALTIIPVVVLTPAVVAPSAISLTVIPTAVLTAATVASSAVALTLVQTKVLAPASTTSSAVPLTITPVVALTPAAVASSAVALTITPVVALTPAAVTSSAVPLTLVQTKILTPAAVTSSAVSLTLTPTAVLSPASVVSSAVALAPIPVVALTPASVASSAVPLTIISVIPLTPASVASSAVALSLGSAGAVTLTPAVVATSAVALTLVPVAVLSTASVASSAVPLTITPVVALTPVTVASTAVPLTLVQTVVLTPAAVTATAVALGIGGVPSVTITPAAVASSAVPLTIIPVVSLNAAGVVSSAVAVVATRIVTISPASVSATAPSLGLVRVVQLTAAGATATAVPLTLVQTKILTPAVVTAAPVALSPYAEGGTRDPGDTFVVVNGVEVPMQLKAVVGGALVDATWAFG